MAKRTPAQDPPEPAAETPADGRRRRGRRPRRAVVDEEEARRVYGAKAAVPAQTPGQPARHARPQRGAAPKGKRRVVIDAQAGRKPAQRRERGPRPEPKKEAELPTGPVKVPSGVTVKDLADALGISPARIITMMMGLGEMVHDHGVALRRGGGAGRHELKREITIQHASDEDDEEADLRRPAGAPAGAAAGGHDHGPRRPRQDDAAGRDPQSSVVTPRPAGSPSTSAPTRWTCRTAAR